MCWLVWVTIYFHCMELRHFQISSFCVTCKKKKKGFIKIKKSLFYRIHETQWMISFSGKRKTFARERRSIDFIFSLPSHFFSPQCPLRGSVPQEPYSQKKNRNYFSETKVPKTLTVSSNILQRKSLLFSEWHTVLRRFAFHSLEE